MSIPYSGLPPDPETLLTRFSFEPWLIIALLALAGAHAWYLRRHPEIDATSRRCAALGWGVTAVALMSPLGALSASLFSARVAQHALITLFAAPLIAVALPARRGRTPLWPATIAFLVVLWFWHMPLADMAALSSTAVYWTMQLTLFGSALMLWKVLLHHSHAQNFTACGAGVFTAMQVGVLGALLSVTTDPLYASYLTISWDGGLTSLEDQQLGGAMLWVPGVVLLLWMSPRWLVSGLSAANRPLPKRAGVRP